MDKWYSGYEDHANFLYFDDILQIPRGSFHEEKISDYIEEQVKLSGLDYSRNSLGDFIIKLPASAGREQEAPLVVQAHTDMVCMKTTDSPHDFTKDPIRVYVEDGWLKTFGTTLGADDGAGLAMILALIKEKDQLSNPPLELVLTVQEEDGMAGAKGLDFSQLSAKRMIGLDGLTLGTTAFSASAVEQTKLIHKITPEECEGGAYRLSVSGLRSGHGGNNIGDGLGNAIKIAGRILFHLNKTVGVRFASIQGGTMVHTIPPCAEVIFKTTAGIGALENAFAEIVSKIYEQQRYADPNMQIEIGKLPFSMAENVRCAAKAESDEIIDMIFAIPVGAQKRDYGHQERIISSYNLSTSATTETDVRFDYVCRTNLPEDCRELYDAAAIFARCFHCEFESISGYDGHTVGENTPLTEVYEKVYSEKYPGDFKRMFMHAGLDAGTIFTALQMNDFIVMMPDVKDVHMPTERMNLQKFADCYDMLKEVIAAC